MEYFKGNKNIVVNHSKKSIVFQPYDREMTLEYLKYWLERLPRSLPYDYTVTLHEFNFNGLCEFDLLAVCEGGRVFCSYTGNYRSIFNGIKQELTLL